MRKFLSLLLFIGFWWILSLIINSETVLPSPLSVIKSVAEIIKDSTFYTALLDTLWKGLLSSFLITLIGVPVGMIMGFSRILKSLLSFFVTVLQSVPVISWLAFAVFLWGVGWKGPVLITTLSLLPIAILNTSEGIMNIDEKLIEMAKVFKVPKKKIIKTIYLGSLSPFMIASLKIILGNVWKTVVVTEYLCGDNGLGFMIFEARSYVDTPKIFALTIFAVLFAVAFQNLTEKLFDRVVKRWKPS